jgi:hypothetical protein
MKSLIANTKAYLKQEASFRKDEEEEAYQEESSSIYDHSYSSPHQQYQEEPPSPKRLALEGAMARIDRMMSAHHSEAEEDRQEFSRINNSIMQSYEKMDAHFKQMMDILKDENCQDQLVANLNEYYMEDECTYYHEQVHLLMSTT